MASRITQTYNLWKSAFWTQVLIVFNAFYWRFQPDNHPKNLAKPNPYVTKWATVLNYIDKKRREARSF